MVNHLQASHAYEVLALNLEWTVCLLPGFLAKPCPLTPTLLAPWWSLSTFSWPTELILSLCSFHSLEDLRHSLIAPRLTLHGCNPFGG